MFFVQKFIKDTFVFCDFIVRCIHCTLSVGGGVGGGGAGWVGGCCREAR